MIHIVESSSAQIYTTSAFLRPMNVTDGECVFLRAKGEGR
jgi:hypothetical protein